MKILFLHGWHSTPGGRKPTYLAEFGYEVKNPALCPDDYDKALETAQSAFRATKPDVVIGSSRGGALAMNIDSGDTPLVLMCPAWKHWGKTQKLEKEAIIIHSPADDVVPFEDSLELVARSGLKDDRLWRIGADHRLADTDALSAMIRACRQLLPQKCQET